jgi:hypothetical protein
LTLAFVLPRNASVMSVKVEPIFDGGCSRQGPTRQPTSRSRSLEEVEVVRLLRRAEDKVVEPVRVVADEDAPAVGLDPAEDDGRGVRRAGRIAQARARIAFAPITFCC